MAAPVSRARFASSPSSPGPRSTRFDSGGKMGGLPTRPRDRQPAASDGPTRSRRYAMTAFLVDLENKPGALATVAEALGARGVNITGVSGATCGDSGRAVITTADDVSARSVFHTLKAKFKQYEVVESSLAKPTG